LPLNVYRTLDDYCNSVPRVYRKDNIFNLSARPIRILAKPIIIDMCNMCVCARVSIIVIKRIWILQYARRLLTVFIYAVCVWCHPPNECTMCTYTYYNLLDAPNIYTLHISRSFADAITRAHIRKPIIIPFLCITAAAMHLCARQIRFQHANLPSVIFHPPVVQFPITSPSSYIVAAISINAIRLSILS